MLIIQNPEYLQRGKRIPLQKVILLWIYLVEFREEFLRNNGRLLFYKTIYIGCNFYETF